MGWRCVQEGGSISSPIRERNKGLEKEAKVGRAGRYLINAIAA